MAAFVSPAATVTDISFLNPRSGLKNTRVCVPDDTRYLTFGVEPMSLPSTRTDEAGSELILRNPCPAAAASASPEPACRPPARPVVAGPMNTGRDVGGLYAAGAESPRAAVAIFVSKATV